MATSHAYRMYFYTGGRMSGVTHIRCEADDEARELASRVSLVSAIEVWNGNRRVCRLSAPSEQADRDNGDDGPIGEAETAKQRLRASRVLLARYRGQDEQLIEGSRVALADSRRLLNRRFVSGS